MSQTTSLREITLRPRRGGPILVVLCGQHDAQPIVNTGTLYN